MPRKPRKPRVIKPAPLSPAWRAFFETGACGNKTAEDCYIFMAEGSYRSMLAAWEPYRETFLKEWKKEGRKGLPWIEKELRRRGKIEGFI
jgi:hypothetical protein